MSNIIVDNSDGGYTDTGTWNSFTNAAAWNGTFRYSTTSGDHADYALTGETNGQLYDVYHCYIWGGGRTTGAAIVVKGHAGATLLSVTEDQTVDPSTTMGVMTFQDGLLRDVVCKFLGQITADGTTGSIVISHADTNVLTTDVFILVPSISTTPIAVTDVNAYASPFATYSDGGGSLQSSNVKGSSTYVEWLQPGNGIRYALTATTTFQWGVDTAALVSASVPSIGYPEIAYTVNGGAWTVVQLASGVTYPISLTGLTGTTQIEVVVKSINHNYDVYTDRCGVKHTGCLVDTGGSTVALSGYYAVRPNAAISFSDSMGIAFQINGSGDDRNSDVRLSWVRMLARRYNCELGLIGLGGIGYGVSGNGGVPAVPTSYSFHHTGASRLVGGLFSPVPNYVFLVLGTNDTAGSPLQTLIQTFLGTVRTAAGSLCKILQYVPIDGNARSNVTGAVTAYQVANPSDLKVYAVDGGTDLQLGFTGSTGFDSVDGTHANVFGETYVAACLAAATATALGGGGGGGGGFPAIGCGFIQGH